MALGFKKHILIVEDEILMLRLLVRFFTRHGYHVLQAVDGEQAVDIYRRPAKLMSDLICGSR